MLLRMHFSFFFFFFPDIDFIHMEYMLQTHTYMAINTTSTNNNAT